MTDAATLAENLSRVQDHLTYETERVRRLLGLLLRYGGHRRGCRRLVGRLPFRCTCGWLEVRADALWSQEQRDGREAAR